MTEAPIKLAGYFLEWQLIEDAKSELADKSKDLFKAMKDEGYDTKAARAVFREKRGELKATSEDVAKAEEAEAIQDLYRAALDSGLTARAGRARETQETPAPEHKAPGLASQYMGSTGANAGGEDVTDAGMLKSTQKAPNEGQTSLAAREGDKSLHSNLQSAETPTADKPEAHTQPLSDASGTLSRDPRDVTFTEYSDGFDPSKLWLNQSGRAA